MRYSLRRPRLQHSLLPAFLTLFLVTMVQSADGQEAEINKFFDELPAWKTSQVKTQPDKPAPPQYYEVVDGAGDRYDFRCSVMAKHVVKEFPSITAAGIDVADLWPGALLQGKSIVGGAPKAIRRLKRSPVTITVDMRGLTATSKVVSDPGAAALQQALADLLRPAGAVPAQVEFAVQEASSFDQAMLDAGISGEYQSVFKAELGGSISRGVSKRTVVASLRQPMFTVSYDRGTTTSAQLFDPSVTLADLQALQQRGEIGADNIPVYVASVTYGKIMTFLMTVDSVTSADEVKAALNASYEGFKGGGNLTAKQKRILANASYKFFVRGGSQESAQEAIATADWHKFFKSETADAAVPLSFVVKTVADDDVATIVDAVEYDELGDCIRPTGYEVKVEWVSVEPTAGACHVPWWFYVRAGTGFFDNAKPSLTQDGSLTSKWNINKASTFQISEAKDVALTIQSEIWAATGNPLLKAAAISYKYPFNAITRGQTYAAHTDVNYAPCPARFNFALTKTPMY